MGSLPVLFLWSGLLEGVIAGGRACSADGRLLMTRMVRRMQRYILVQRD